MVKKYSYEKDKDVKLSDNFSVWEFQCRDKSDEILIDDELVNKLELLRKKVGKITVVSGYRTKEYNRTKGTSSDNSYHIQGKAATIKSDSISLEKLAREAEVVGFKGIILDNDSVDVSIRDNQYYCNHGTPVDSFNV